MTTTSVSRANCANKMSIYGKVHLLQDPFVVEPAGQAFDPALGPGAIRNLVATLGSWVLLLPTIPLMSAASVVKCLATVPVG